MRYMFQAEIYFDGILTDGSKCPVTATVDVWHFVNERDAVRVKVRYPFDWIARRFVPGVLNPQSGELSAYCAGCAPAHHLDAEISE